MKVVIVDDQERFCAALATVVEVTEGLELGGTHRSVAELRRAMDAAPAEAAAWDVVLMDVDMPGENGLVGLRLVKERSPGTRVVMCTVYDDGETVAEAVRCGADGYLLKSAPLEVLLGRLEELRTGGAPLAARAARGLMEQLRAPERPPVPPRWEVAADGSEVRTPAGAVIDLSRRRAARRFRAALARERVGRPGVPRASAAGIEAGWPGERMAWASAQARLWTAIRTLRSAGLAPIVETVGEGYRLATAARVRA